MDISGITNASTALNAASTQQEVSMAVLKKAINISAEGALSLIQSIPNNQSAHNLPAHLGKNINTTA
ncbi:MAG: YjfB family protein [Nitrosomonas sp.]|nr:YjfB family protein [Nitrosomonas sp.]